MTKTVRDNSGYKSGEFNNLVDSVLAACDSNGCDGGTEKSNTAHCIKIDGDNSDDNHGNIHEFVGKFIKGPMHTDDTIDDCTGYGWLRLPDRRQLNPAGGPVEAGDLLGAIKVAVCTK
ncbi:hypothetical protein PG985_002385 [Apiospora marii]|uniref:uncharacterized protein n=1 Tax=Apiospora marii TaxID=335849 RepID=UPI00312D0DDD